jgi:AcrR family transcriptional regulator
MSKLTTNAQEPRRQPSQSRGQARVTAILETAERLFARDGIERVTTNQIASEAGISIGSIYQFFSNKDAILAALADRYHGVLGEAILGSAGDIATMSVPDLTQRMVSAGVGFLIKHETFARLMLTAPAQSPLAAAGARLQKSMAGLIESVITARAPWIDVSDRKAYAVMAQVLQRGTLIRILEERAAGNHALAERLVEESIRMQTAYFEALLSEHSTTAPGADGR